MDEQDLARRRRNLARLKRHSSLMAARTWPLGAARLADADRLSRPIGDLMLFESRGEPVIARSTPSGAGRAVRLAALVARGAPAAYRTAEGRLRALDPSEILLACSDAALDVRSDPRGRVIGLTVPLHLLVPRFLPIERLQGGLLRPHSGAVAQLLRDLVAGLATPERATPGPGALADALGGLLSAMLEDCWTRDAPSIAERQGRLHIETIEAYVRRQFADPDLTPSDVAKAVGVSRRYLHRLYTEAGRSFRGDLIALRIEACLKAFADPRQAQKTVAEIAFAAGYTDISQFNRHFRRLRGETPTAVRRALLGVVPRARRPGERGRQPAAP